MRLIDKYEWGTIYADLRDPDAGGASHEYTIGLGGTVADLVIQFQHGPRNVEGSVMGILDDHLLSVIEDRLDSFMGGPFACEATNRALAYVRAAQNALRERAEERRARGVLGLNQP